MWRRASCDNASNTVATSSSEGAPRRDMTCVAATTLSVRANDSASKPDRGGPIPNIAHEWTAGWRAPFQFVEVLGIGDPARGRGQQAGVTERAAPRRDGGALQRRERVSQLCADCGDDGRDVAEEKNVMEWQDIDDELSATGAQELLAST